MFRLSALLAVLGSAAALKSDSAAGKSLISKSRRVEGDQNYEWLMNYSMVFQSCHTITHFADDAGQDEEAVQYKNLVKFKLCPANKCKYGCKGAEYLTDMNEFVDAWTEWTMEEQEQKCEYQRELCGCDQDDNVDEDVCYASCFSSAGMSECIDQDAGDDDGFVFDLQEWLECKESEALDSYGNALYVGPKCSKSGNKINLGVFTDEFCTEEYSSAVFANYYGGVTLPYQKENIVAENCIACKQEAEDQYGYAEVTELCEEMYPEAAKCETNIAKQLYYPSTKGCDFINNIQLYEKGYKPVNGRVATAFAVIFGMATVALAAVAAHLFQMNNRKIDLQSDAAIV